MEIRASEIAHANCAGETGSLPRSVVHMDWHEFIVDRSEAVPCMEILLPHETRDFGAWRYIWDGHGFSVQ